MKKSLALAILTGLLLIGCTSPTSTDFESRLDLTEYSQVYTYLKFYYFYQEELPSAPFLFSTPASLFENLSDPYTQYIDAETADSFLSFFSTENTAGLGILLRQLPDSQYVIMQVVASSPASHAGVHKGDTLISVNAIAVSGLPFDSLALLLTGRSGSAVNLELRRITGIETLAVVRGSFIAPTVYADTMADSIPYIGLLEFMPPPDGSTMGTSDELEAALAQTEHLGSTRPTILDLRGNPGPLILTPAKAISRTAYTAAVQTAHTATDVLLC